MPPTTTSTKKTRKSVPTKRSDFAAGWSDRRALLSGKGAAYIGLTKSALRVAIHRGQMPGHKTRTNPEDENSDGVWWFNAKEWDKLADELPEHEPQNGTTGKVTGRMTARKGSSLQLIKKTARPLTVSEFIQAEAQNWTNSETTEATNRMKTNTSDFTITISKMTKH